MIEQILEIKMVVQIISEKGVPPHAITPENIQFGMVERFQSAAKIADAEAQEVYRQER